MCVYFRGHRERKRERNRGKGRGRKEEGIIFNQREEGTGLIPLYISYL